MKIINVGGAEFNHAFAEKCARKMFGKVEYIATTINFQKGREKDLPYSFRDFAKASEILKEKACLLFISTTGNCWLYH